MKRGIFTRQLPRILLLCLVPFLLLLSLVLRLLMSLRFIRRLVVISGFFPCLVMSSSFFPRLGISSKFVRPNSAPLYKFGVEIARWGLTGTRHEKAIIYVGLETGITTQQRIDDSLQGGGKFNNKSAHLRRIRRRSRNRTRTMTSYSCRTASWTFRFSCATFLQGSKHHASTVMRAELTVVPKGLSDTSDKG